MIKNLKKFFEKLFIIVKFLKCAKKYYEIRKLFLLLFYTVQREVAQRESPNYYCFFLLNLGCIYSMRGYEIIMVFYLI